MDDNIAFDDLLERAERLRIGLRDSVNPFNQGRFSQEEYSLTRSLLIASAIAEPLLPHWLQHESTLSSAVATLLRSVERRGNYVKRCRETIEKDLAPAIAALETAESDCPGDRSSIVGRRIQVRIDHFFQTPMTVEPRAIQSLSLAPARVKTYDRLLTLWRNALLLYPALAAVLEDALPSDANYPALVQYISRNEAPRNPNDVSDRFILNALAQCFMDRSRKQLKPYAEELRSTRHLSTLDLLIGPLMPPSVSVYRIPPLAIALRSRRDSFSGSNEFHNYVNSFLVNLTTSFNRLRALDHSCGDQQFAVIDEGKRVRVVPFGTWSYCQSPSRAHDQPYPFRNNVMQPAGLFSQESLAVLEHLINEGSLECEFQTFFERNPEYLQVLGPYTHIHPQLVLTEDTGTRLVPDFFLENFHTGFCDICDLKRPTEGLFKEVAGRPQFRDRVMAGVRQLSQYRDYFEDRDNRRIFETRYGGLRAFRPRIILVIGRRENFYDELERVKLKSELRDWVTVHTYDDVIQSARQWQKRVRDGQLKA